MEVSAVATGRMRVAREGRLSGPRRLMAGAVTLLAVVAVAAGLLSLQSRDGGAIGPPGLLMAIDVMPGGVGSLGTVELPNPGRQTMQVVSVRLLDPRGVAYEGATVVTPGDRAERGSYDAGPGFPPEGWPYGGVRALDETVPAAAFSRAPAEAPLALKVLVAARATRSGVVGFAGVEVVYRTGQRTRTERFRHGMVLCVAPSRCADPDHEERLRELGLGSR